MDSMVNVSASYASLWKRFLALFLDSLIVLIPAALAGDILPVLGGLIVWFFYAPVLESSKIQATLGKYCLSIRVTDLTGQRITLKAATIRNALKCVSSVMVFVGFVFALFSSKKQTFHDLLSDTLVMEGRIEHPVTEAWVENVKTVFGNTTLSEIERLQALREKGALTEEEFQEQKKAILSGKNY